MKRSVWLSVLAATMVSGIESASAMVGRWDFSNQLTLYPHNFGLDSASGIDSYGLVDHGELYSLNPHFYLAPGLEIARLNFTSFGDGVLLMEGQQEHGWGVGVSSTGGLAVMGGYVTRDNIEYCVYYLRRMSDIPDDPTDDTSFGPMSQPDNTVGVRLSIQF